MPGWVEGRHRGMTLEEKIGQMFMIDLNTTVLNDSTRKFLRAGRFGNVILFGKNLITTEQSRLLISELHTAAVTDHGIPMLIAVDQEGGSVDRLSQVSENPVLKHSARQLGNLFGYQPARTTRLVKAVTREVADEMKNIGLNMNLAPVLDLASHKESYIYDRSFSGDPRLVTRISKLIAKEFSNQRIITTGKHFPNLSSTIVDSHSGLPFLHRSLKQLLAYEFRPFLNLRNQVDAMMVGHVMVPAIDKHHPTSISPKAIRLLRDKIKFDGVVITDDIKMGALSQRYPYREIVLRAIHAGADIIIMAWDPEKQLAATKALAYAVRKGVIPETRIDEAVLRILTLKYKYLMNQNNTHMATAAE